MNNKQGETFERRRGLRSNTYLTCCFVLQSGAVLDIPKGGAFPLAPMVAVIDSSVIFVM
jgi:hypothetical protein